MSDARVFQRFRKPPGEATAPAKVLLPDDGQALPECIQSHAEVGRLDHGDRALIDQDDASQHAEQRTTDSRGRRKGAQLPQRCLGPVKRRDRNRQ